MAFEGRLPPMTNPAGYLYRAAHNTLKTARKKTDHEVLVGDNWDGWTRVAQEYDEPDDLGGTPLGDLVQALKPHLTPGQFPAHPASALEALAGGSTGPAVPPGQRARTTRRPPTPRRARRGGAGAVSRGGLGGGRR
ncbi:hypothetical protein ACFVFS_10835 [Kitasatospora sp. NPDC057692]|uniref:hypothetical protein n=1 Tax=Kitasatospora sp. NPDC057692 TaxID=3346215 RepID=UPI00367F01F7